MKIDLHYTPRALGLAGADVIARHIPDGAEVLEPCAGPGRLADVLRERGYRVTTGDLDPDVRHLVDHAWDFPEAVALGRVAPFDAVVTNPPYSLIPEFARASLQVADVVALLLPVRCLEETEGRSAALLRQLAEVVVLPRMEFDPPTGARRSPTSVPFGCAWFVWRRGWTGPAALTRVSREELAALQGQTSILDMVGEVRP